MIGETAAAAIAKICADLPHVVAGDGRAAQGAKRLGAGGAVIDNNEAEHVGPPLVLLGFTRNGAARVGRRLCRQRLISRNRYSLNLSLVIAICVRKNAARYDRNRRKFIPKRRGGLAW
jgi:hypothetical protein